MPHELIRVAVRMIDDRVPTVNASNHADVIAVRGDVLRQPDLLSRVDVAIAHGVRYK